MKFSLSILEDRVLGPSFLRPDERVWVLIWMVIVLLSHPLLGQAISPLVMSQPRALFMAGPFPDRYGDPVIWGCRSICPHGGVSSQDLAWDGPTLPSRGLGDLVPKVAPASAWKSMGESEQA